MKRKLLWFLMVFIVLVFNNAYADPYLLEHNVSIKDIIKERQLHYSAKNSNDKCVTYIQGQDFDSSNEAYIFVKETNKLIAGVRMIRLNDKSFEQLITYFTNVYGTPKSDILISLQVYRWDIKNNPELNQKGYNTIKINNWGVNLISSVVNNDVTIFYTFGDFENECK